MGSAIAQLPLLLAVDGQVAFASGAQARAAMPGIAHAFRRIDPELIDSEGRRTQQAGYFSGIVERHAGGWRFRDAHWSAPGT
jgi:hypothetical protein